MGARFTFLLLFLSQATFAVPMTDRDYANVKQTVQEIAQQNPNTTQLINLGISDSGDSIIGLQIGSGAVAHMLVSTHHGNEYGSTEVALEFANQLAENPIPGQTIYVVPVLNINGYNARNREESIANDSFDPNRDYPGPCGTEGPFHLKSTKALADFIAQKNIVASATLHTYFPTVAYPWGLDSEDLMTEYTDLFISLANAATYLSHYEVGNSTEVIYPANGTYEDYAFWKHGIWSLLFELGDTHTPDLAQVKELLRVNVPGIRKMFEEAPSTRAVQHDFTGRCSTRLSSLDRHDE